jgi:hypothetical protein
LKQKSNGSKVENKILKTNKMLGKNDKNKTFEKKELRILFLALEENECKALVMLERFHS